MHAHQSYGFAAAVARYGGGVHCVFPVLQQRMHIAAVGGDERLHAISFFYSYNAVCL